METFLPFREGTYVQVTQGNNNPDPAATHNANTSSGWAYDFNLAAGNVDEGSEIVAASAGTVAKIKEDTPNDVTGEAGRGQDNHILIALPNGTCDAYLHIQQNSVSEFGLAVGSQVARGQKIARLGKTGYCFGAHLHFQRQKCGQDHCGPFPCTQNRIQPSTQIIFPEFDVPNTVPSTNHVHIANRWFVSRNTLQVGPPATLKDTLQASSNQRANGLLIPAGRSFAAFAQQNALGSPLSTLLQRTGPDGLSYALQVFEADTLYLRVDPGGATDWNDIHRMTDLLRPIAPGPGHQNDWEAFRQMILALAQPANKVGRWLWEQTYSNVGLTFNDKWASHWFAIGQVGTDPLGAPLGGGPQGGQYMLTVGGVNYWAEVYARDTIYWQEGQYRYIHRMSTL